MSTGWKKENVHSVKCRIGVYGWLFRSYVHISRPLRIKCQSTSIFTGLFWADAILGVIRLQSFDNTSESLAERPLDCVKVLFQGPEGRENISLERLFALDPAQKGKSAYDL